MKFTEKIKYIQILLFFVGIVFVLYGITRGEIERLFVKATKIGLECIKLREYGVNL